MYPKESAVSSDESENESRWSRRERIYECTRCGYISERKSNVGRHFERIHCELKKHKTCICGKTFVTKGDYYEHCDKTHPLMRHSWYITTEKYKIGKLKAKVRKSTRVKLSEKRELRSSLRILSLYNKQVHKEPDIIDNNNVNSVSVDKPLNDTANKVDLNQIHCFEPPEDFNKENIIVNKENNISNSISKLQVSEFDECVTRLPLKKRFGNLSRTCLSDVTNFNNNRSSINHAKCLTDNLNNNEPQFYDQNLAKINEQQRDFISQIDFDELDAILNLKYLKESSY